MLNVTPHDPQIHRPAEARDAPMLVLAGPADVVEVDGGVAVLLLQVEADTGSHPVDIGARHLQLEGGILDALGHFGAPVILGTEPQLVFRALFGLTGRALSPPLIQSMRCADGIKDFRCRPFDQEVVKDIGHGHLFYFVPSVARNPYRLRIPRFAKRKNSQAPILPALSTSTLV